MKIQEVKSVKVEELCKLPRSWGEEKDPPPKKRQNKEPNAEYLHSCQHQNGEPRAQKQCDQNGMIFSETKLSN